MKVSNKNQIFSISKIIKKTTFTQLNFIIFLIISMLSTSHSLAQTAADIVCVDAAEQNSVQINTRTQQVWYNQSTVISGAVFSGIYSPQNFVGEILAETTINGTDYYITLIMRSSNGHPQLEVLWYPKQNSTKSTRMLLDDCFLQQN